MATPTREYLGDAVYIDYDGFVVTLTTESGLGPAWANNVIILEPEVIARLDDYLMRLKKALLERHQNETNSQAESLPQDEE